MRYFDSGAPLRFTIAAPRPGETRTLQAPLPQHEPAPFPVEGPAPGAPAVGAHKELRRERVHRQRTLHQRREPRELLSEIDGLDAPPYFDVLVGRTDHGSRLAHSSTVAQTVPSACVGTSTTTLGRCTRHAALGAAMCIGTNLGADAPGSFRSPR